MSLNNSSHQVLQAHDTVGIGSNRSFGVVFTVLFMTIGLFPLIDGGNLRIWSLVIAGFFLFLAMVVPQALKPLNAVWLKLGLVLHDIANPIVMWLLFFLIVTPVAFYCRIVGKDILSLKTDTDLDSYWIKRNPAGPEGQSMKRQF
ncbi:MAG: SxtJ family membrane protein [Rhodospirillales bacterium]|nr:SxtJ family membrane protein [Rhodospirillales bacterium]